MISTEFIDVLKAIDSVVEIDETAATFQKGVQLRAPSRLTSRDCRVEDNDVCGFQVFSRRKTLMALTSTPSARAGKVFQRLPQRG